MSRMGKAHSASMAREYIRLGWKLKYEFRAPDCDQPYEYVFGWEGAGEGPQPSLDPAEWGDATETPTPEKVESGS